VAKPNPCKLQGKMALKPFDDVQVVGAPQVAHGNFYFKNTNLT
jgi:hypothetical protein